mgnify:CR=1 FL=1
MLQRKLLTQRTLNITNLPHRIKYSKEKYVNPIELTKYHTGQISQKRIESLGKND